MKLFLSLLLLSISAYAQSNSTKVDTFFNPKCQATVIWKAVAEHRDIEELHICQIMQMPNSRTWRPRYDANASKDYVETEEDRRNKPPIDIEAVNKLLQANGYHPHSITKPGIKNEHH